MHVQLSRQKCCQHQCICSTWAGTKSQHLRHTRCACASSWNTSRGSRGHPSAFFAAQTKLGSMIHWCPSRVRGLETLL